MTSADPVEAHRPGTRAEPGGEHLAVVGQDLARGPEPGDRQLQRRAHRPRGRTRHDQGRDHEPGVVIDPRDDLRLGPVDQPDPADHIHLPQVHRDRPLPPAVVRALAPPGRGSDQALTDQAPVHRGPTRQRLHTRPAQPVQDRARPPPRMLGPHRHDPRLDGRRHLMRARPRPARAISQRAQPTGGIRPQPRVHGLPRHPEPASDVSHARPVAQDLQHRPIALLHQTQLHQHRRPPPDDRPTPVRRRRHPATPNCQPGTGATVAHLPGPRPETVSHLPGPRCPA